LRTVLRNGAINRRKPDTRRRSPERAVAGAPTDGAAPDELVGAMEMQRRLAAGVLALPDEQRVPVLMRFLLSRSR
jgi:DNA-directed RNA polymerase specialized sigma24 family protein